MEIDSSETTGLALVKVAKVIGSIEFVPLRESQLSFTLENIVYEIAFIFCAVFSDKGAPTLADLLALEPLACV